MTFFNNAGCAFSVLSFFAIMGALDRVWQAVQIFHRGSN